MKPSSITFRLAAAFCLLAAVLFVVGWQGASHLRQLNMEMQNSVGDQWKEVQLTHEAFHLSEVNSRLTLLIFLLDDQDEIKRLLAERAANTKRISDLMSNLEPRLNPQERKFFAVVQATRTPYIESYQQALSLLFTGNNREEARKMMMEVVRPKLTTYHNAWNAFDQHETAEIDQSIQETNTDYVTDQRQFLITLVAAGAMTLAIAIFTVARMGSEIAVRHRAELSLQLAHDKLEERVLERTVELQKTNDTLRESEEKFRQMAENITDMFWMTSPDMQQVLYVSPAYESIWGHSAESLYAHPQQWVEAIPPEDRERVFTLFSSLGTGISSASTEFQISCPDGEVRWINGRGFPVRDAAGNVIRLTGIASDITERKLAEEASAQLAALVNSSNDAIIGKDLNSIVTSWNIGAEKLFGYSSNEMIGNSITRLIPADRQQEELEIIGRVKKGESVEHFETLRMAKDGRLIDLSVTVSLIKDKAGKIVGASKVARDITERKQAAAARDRLAAILEATPDYVGISDSNGRRLYLNPAGRNLLGIDLHEDITKTVIADSLPNPNSHPILTEGLPTAIRQGIWIGETVLLSRSGKEILVSVIILAHKNPNGEVEFLSTIMRDITERKLNEARMVQSQKMEMVGKLAGGVAHEFNSILTAIIGQSELLLSDLPPDAPLGKNVREIRQAADRAATLTRQLLAYGRKQILQPEILDLNRVLTDMTSTLQHLMGSEVDMRIIPAVGLKTVKIDPGQMEQVIVNIAMNAADAMPNGGKFTLETANVTLDEEFVRPFPGLKAGNYVMLAMTDTGTGMSKEVEARIFEPFFSTKGVGQGTGLGLATCYGILKQSNGHINVYTELAHGSSFKIYLPQVEQPTKIPLPRLKAPDLPRGTETILLAEDDPSLREMSATLLRRLGYTVLTTANGVEALNLKQQRDIGPIDLLFTDIVMPHMSGKELSDRIRTIFPSARILFTSAYTENSILHQGILNDGVILLQKPFTPSALAHKVREVLDQ